MSANLHALDIPDSIFTDNEAEGSEFVRFWICDGNDHVALNISSFQPPKQEAFQWGYLAADIAKHAVRGMLQDDPSRGSSEQLFAEIERGFLERLKQEVSFTGQLRGAQ